MDPSCILDKSPTTTNHSLWKEVVLNTKYEDTGAGSTQNLAAYSRQPLRQLQLHKTLRMMDGPLSLAKGMKREIHGAHNSADRQKTQKRLQQSTEGAD